HYWAGDFRSAEQDFATGSTMNADSGTSRTEGATPIPFFAYASWNAWTLGHADLARKREAEMKSVVDVNRPYDLAWSGYYAAHLHLFMRDDIRCAAVAERALDLSIKRQFPYTAAASRCVLGHARAQLGRPDEGAALIRDGIANLVENGAGLLVSNFTTYLAV